MTPTRIPMLARRRLLQSLAGASTAWAMPGLWAQSSAGAGTLPGPAAPGTGGRLVVVFLRGAYDGLSALVPHSDPHYAALRPNIAIPAPDGTDQTAIALDSAFGLHPALAPLLPMWKEGVMAAVPAAGSPDPTRSHFDAQHHWEIGIPGKGTNAPGWMNTLAGVHSSTWVPHPATQRNASASSTAPLPASPAATAPGAKAAALGVGEANPQILAGAAPVQLVPRGEAATKQGVMADERTRQALLALYSGQDDLSRNFRAGADSRAETAQTLTTEMAGGKTMMGAEMQAANNGAGPAKGLALDAQHLGILMRQNPRLRLGFLSAGGWDTHAGQGGVTGVLANNLGSLATALVQLRRDFSQPNDMVVVFSEFGRTSAENGTRGTDHGHGNAMWLIGQRVQGGRWHGGWDGLAKASLHEGRDLPVKHDFRSVLAQVLSATQGLKAHHIDTLFPGFAWDASLDGLMRTRS